jgi:hypothetical protein
MSLFARTLFLLLPLAAPAAFAAEANAVDASRARLVCAYRTAKRLLPEVERAGSYDKFRHCTMSCWVTLECGRVEAWGIGVAKEIRDLLCQGSPSLEDIRADNDGIRFALDADVSTRDDCVRACDEIHPRDSSGDDSDG